MNEEKEAEGDRLRRECAARREEQFTQSMKAVADGMEGRIAHLTLADEHVRFQEEWRRQKSREIHAEWEHKVYDKIAQVSSGWVGCSEPSCTGALSRPHPHTHTH